jgi:hypothetical protein
MDYKETIAILTDMHKEIEKNSPAMSSLILISNHETGESYYLTSGFIEVQVNLLKMLFEQDKVLQSNFIFEMLKTGKVS